LVCILFSVYSGHHSILVPPLEVELNPCIWLATVSNYKVRDTFCSYSVMELCTKGLRSSVLELKVSCMHLCGPGLCLFFFPLYQWYQIFESSPDQANLRHSCFIFIFLFFVLKQTSFTYSSFNSLTFDSNNGTLLRRYLKVQARQHNL
jgi:hypothetical protein